MTPKETCEKLIELIKQKKISKYRIAQELKIEWNTVHNWARGIYLPRKDRLEAIEKLIQKTLDTIV